MTPPVAGKEAAPLRYRTARAALTSGSAEMLTRVLTIVLSIVTARALEPREVGILGIAVIGAGLLSMLGFYAVTAAVVARKGAEDGRFALAAFVIRAAVIGLAVFAAAMTLPSIVPYFAGGGEDADHLRKLLGILLLYPLAELAATYPQVVLQRRLDLGFLAVTQVVQPVVFVGLAVFFLANDYGTIGVSWANVAASLAVTILTWGRLWRRRWFVRHGWPSAGTWREVLGGTLKLFTGGFGGYVGGRIDNLVVSATLGPAAMSFYSMAWNASRVPANVFASAISFVFIPTLARIQEEPERVQRALRECLKHSYLLLAPACAVLFVSAPLLVKLTFGAKWLPLVPALRVMSVTVLCGPLLFALAALLTGTGRAHLVGIATVIQILALLLVIPILARHWGVVGAAYGDLLAVVMLTITLYITARVATNQVSWSLLNTLLVPVVAGVTAGSLAWSVGGYVTQDILRLLSEIALVLTGYLLIVLALGGRGRLFDLSMLLRGIISRHALVNTP